MTNRITIISILSIIFTVLITGCVIIPQTASIPLMTKKNEIQLDGGITVLPGVTGTLTYAPTNLSMLIKNYLMHLIILD